MFTRKSDETGLLFEVTGQWVRGDWCGLSLAWCSILGTQAWGEREGGRWLEGDWFLSCRGSLGRWGNLQKR